ncbi:MAG: PEPxxWA-CTERM sorting domain-containing protein [Gammaproteobacteria bacterium]|nr:PEPxxWA-CTERM sorting domain-containing protein [Gammaproteobacteria bacterium]MBU1482912.1 PEPxxWA-CTERM sorting domain-containing protein [Gammaproteobacteria bacterium]
MASLLLVSVTANAVVLSAAPATNTTVLTFDDLPGHLSLVPNGYAGFQWNNFGSTTIDQVPGSGYETGTVSGSNTIFNLGGTPASFSSASAFSLIDAFFTGAWNDGLQIHVVATGGSNTYTKDFTVDTSGPVDIFFNWSGINSVSFFSSGGSPNSSLVNTGYGTHFVMDNLSVVSSVPEPATYAMLLVGLGFIGFMARRRESFCY